MCRFKLTFAAYCCILSFCMLSCSEQLDYMQEVEQYPNGSSKTCSVEFDVYYLHRVNPEIAVEDVAEGMGRLIEEGQSMATKDKKPDTEEKIVPVVEVKDNTEELSSVNSR